jgi:hypothetical protein
LATSILTEYQLQNNNELTPEQAQVMKRIFAQAGGVGV